MHFRLASLLSLLALGPCLTGQSAEADTAPNNKAIAQMRVAQSGDFSAGAVFMSICASTLFSKHHPDIKTSINISADDMGHSVVAPAANTSGSETDWILDVREKASNKSHVELRVGKSVPSEVIKDVWAAVEECGEMQ